MSSLTTDQTNKGIEISNQLIAAARDTMNKMPTNDNHSVVSAALTKDGKTIAAFNVTHFTGGPCAEPVVFGAAAAQGYLPTDLTHIVAINNRTRDVISPCGKCRQMFLDFCPEILVAVKDREELRVVDVRTLLPFAYVGKKRYLERVEEGTGDLLG